MTKDTKGHSLKVKLIGILEHGPENSAALFTMTENFETGANHVIECLHRYLNRRNATRGLTSTLTIQMDNCTRENKNRYALGYLEALVAWGVFVEVHACFLPLGHTHTDIDQLFSRTATRLHTHTAVTLEDLHTERRQAHTPTPVINNIKNVINFSGLCDREKTLWEARNDPFTQNWYFRFVRAEQGMHNRADSTTYKTKCLVKINSMDDWVPFRATQSDDGYNGFLKKLPDLSKTPGTTLTSPTDLNDIERRLSSEETRINSRDKMDALRALVQDVYTTKTEMFHWDVANSVESKRVPSTELGILQTAHDVEDSSEANYETNWFVAVRHDEPDDPSPFWLGKISSVKKNRDGKAVSLRVQWYDTKIGANKYKAA